MMTGKLKMGKRKLYLLDELEKSIILQHLSYSDEELEKKYIEDKYDIDHYNETGELIENEYYIDNNHTTTLSIYPVYFYILVIMSERKPYFTKEKLIELDCNLNYEDVFGLFKDYLENKN
jgi:hypothetical protein